MHFLTTAKAIKLVFDAQTARFYKKILQITSCLLVFEQQPLLGFYFRSEFKWRRPFYVILSVFPNDFIKSSHSDSSYIKNFSDICEKNINILLHFHLLRLLGYFGPHQSATICSRRRYLHLLIKILAKSHHKLTKRLRRPKLQQWMAPHKWKANLRRW